MEGADGGVRDHYTPKKSCVKWGHRFSLDFVHNFLGVSHLQPHHPAAPIQLKSRWICQNRAGSSRIPRGKTLKKIMSSKSIYELHSSQKIIKNGLRSSKLFLTKRSRYMRGVPQPKSYRTIPNFVRRLMYEHSATSKQGTVHSRHR